MTWPRYTRISVSGNCATSVTVRQLGRAKIIVDRAGYTADSGSVDRAKKLTSATQGPRVRQFCVV
jgi:hypothetical protein